MNGENAYDLLAGALELARLGYYVFPSRVTLARDPQGGIKKVASFVNNWDEASTRDPQTILGWFGMDGFAKFGDEYQTPTTVCIDCGKSGVVFVDLDEGEGKHGIANWEAIEAEHGPMPTPLISRTPGGGEHRGYRAEPERPVTINNTGKVAPNVDIRGIGGLIFAPPSRDDRGTYAWVNGLVPPSELPPVPDEVVKRMTPRPRPAPTRVTAATDKGKLTVTTPENLKRIQGMVATMLRGNRDKGGNIDGELDKIERAYEGTRNGIAFSAACNLHEAINAGWMDHDSTLDLYMAACEVASDNGHTAFDGREAYGHWRGAERHIGGRARELPASMFEPEVMAGFGSLPPLPPPVATNGANGHDHATGAAGVAEEPATPTGDTQDQADEDDDERAGWRRVNIADILSGTRKKILPELGRRNDGIPLLYRGKEHSIASEPECGKTWFALLAVKDVLIRGGRVVYVDFEDDAETIVGRLLDLCVLPARLTEEANQFRYVRPEAAYQLAWFAELLTFGEGTYPDLVVYDGVTEGMQLFDLDPLGQTDAAKWRRLLIKPVLRLGAATISTDHVVKDKDKRGGWAIGAQHKKAGLNGVQFMMEQVEPFGRGLKGRSRVLVSKDRNGGLRQHGKPTEQPGITHLGDLVGDATSGEMESLIFWPPFDDDGVDQDDAAPPREIATVVGKVSDVLKAATEALSFNQVVNEAKSKETTVRRALVWLHDKGYIEIANGSRGSRMHRWAYREEGPSA